MRLLVFNTELNYKAWQVSIYLRSIKPCIKKHLVGWFNSYIFLTPVTVLIQNINHIVAVFDIAKIWNL